MMQIASDLKQVLREPEKRRFIIMRTAGNFLVLFALFGVFATFYPAVKSELKYRLEKWQGVEYKVEKESGASEGGLAIVKTFKETSGNPLAKLLVRDRKRVERIAPASTDFGIVIPKIGANAVIIPNVDAGDEDVYQQALMQGVAHAKGTGFPGNKATLLNTPEASLLNRKIYLFAHSTDNWWNINRYNAVFFLLRELKAGDEVDLFYQGSRHIYSIVERKIVDPREVRYLTEASDKEVLILQTCWPPGTTFKRLIVIARPIASLARK